MRSDLWWDELPIEDSEADELRRERDAQHKYDMALMAHPNPQDPDFPGFEGDEE